MKNHKSNIQEISEELFDKINHLIDDYSFDGNIQINKLSFFEGNQKNKGKVKCRLVRNPRTGQVELVCRREE